MIVKKNNKVKNKTKKIISIKKKLPTKGMG